MNNHRSNSYLFAMHEHASPIGMVIAIPKGKETPEYQDRAGEHLPDDHITDFCCSVDLTDATLNTEGLASMLHEDTPIKQQSVSGHNKPSVTESFSYLSLFGDCDYGRVNMHSKPTSNSNDNQKVPVAKIFVHNIDKHRNSGCFNETDPIQHDGRFNDNEFLASLASEPESLSRFYWDSDKERLDYVQDLTKTEMPSLELGQIKMNNSKQNYDPVSHKEPPTRARRSRPHRRFRYRAASIRRASRKKPKVFELRSDCSEVCIYRRDPSGNR